MKSINWTWTYDENKDGKPDFKVRLYLGAKGLILAVIPESRGGKLVFGLIVMGIGYLLGHYFGVI